MKDSLMIVCLVATFAFASGCNRHPAKQAAGVIAAIIAEQTAREALANANVQTVDNGYYRWKEFSIDGPGNKTIRIKVSHTAGPPVDVILLTRSEFEEYRNSKNSTYSYFKAGTRMRLDHDFDSGPIALASGKYVLVIDNSAAWGDTPDYSGTSSYKLAFR